MINNRAREISADEYADRQAQIDSSLMDIHTALPAIVVSFNSEERTVKAQPAIQRVFNNGEGFSGAHNLPVCVDVPVMFLGGGGYDITYPINEGDECLLIFSERCIDTWFIRGEPSPPGDYRQHDLSDAFALVGVRSLARKLPINKDGLSIGGHNSNILLNNEAVTITKGGAVLSLSDKKLECSVPIHAPNMVTDRFNVNDHIHDGVEVGTGATLEGY